MNRQPFGKHWTKNVEKSQHSGTIFWIAVSLLACLICGLIGIALFYLFSLE